MVARQSLEQQPSAGLHVLSREAVERLDWQPVPACPRVDEKELYSSGGLVDALIRYQPDATTPGHAHPVAHHIWVVAGELVIAGHRLTAGSFVYVPAGIDHPITTGPDGCTLLQMHRP